MFEFNIWAYRSWTLNFDTTILWQNSWTVRVINTPYVSKYSNLRSIYQNWLLSRFEQISDIYCDMFRWNSSSNLYINKTVEWMRINLRKRYKQNETKICSIVNENHLAVNSFGITNVSKRIILLKICMVQRIPDEWYL